MLHFFLILSKEFTKRLFTISCSSVSLQQTDDKGVFETTLSDEYWIASQTFSLSMGNIWGISKSALDYGFLAPEEREHLRIIWADWHKQNNLDES